MASKKANKSESAADNIEVKPDQTTADLPEADQQKIMDNKAAGDQPPVEAPDQERDEEAKK